MRPFVKTPYNYDRDAISRETAMPDDQQKYPSVTQQQFAEECDINTIVRRFGLDGDMPLNPHVPVSGDFTNITDFQDAMNAVVVAEAAFMQLPAQLRFRFHNDPQELMDFVADDHNIDEARKLGLLKDPIPKSEPVRVIMDTPTPTTTKDTPP